MSNQKKSTKGNAKSMNSSQQPRKARVQNKQNGNKSNNGPVRSVAVAYSSQQKGGKPRIEQKKDSILVSHRELIGNISGAATSAFTSNFSLELNPGLIATFPWLATIAQNWETYKFRKLRLCYVTRTGSTTVGSVLIAPDYDAADSSPATEQIMSSYANVVENVPWQDINCLLNPSAMHPDGKRKFIRTSGLSANLDIKTYDVGALYVNTVDSTGAAPWGKLWIEYEVELHTPQAQTSLPVGLSGGKISGGTMSGAMPLGSTATVDANASGISYSNTTGAVTFEKTGTYCIAFSFVGTVMSAPVYTLVNCTSLTAASTFDAAATGGRALVMITVDASNGTLTPSLTATTVTTCIMFIGCSPDSSLT